MSLLSSSSIILPCFHTSQFKVYHLGIKDNALSDPNFTLVYSNIRRALSCVGKTVHPVFKKKQASILRFISRDCVNATDMYFGGDGSNTLDRTDQELEEIKDAESPWEGAIIYQRIPSISHVEYCTTLERLGLEKLSTEVSKSRASVMGLRITKAVKDFPLGTPVLVSIDITKKKQKLRLDGIIRTVITLACNRCGEATAECVFSNFSLLLMEEPIEEPDVINMGVIFAEDKFRTSGNPDEEDDDEASIDLDDRLYFPPEEKSIDISKHIRDMVHLEITINAICDPKCKGLCLQCGANLNTSTCDCSKQEKKEKGYGPLRDLRKQMQQ